MASADAPRRDAVSAHDPELSPAQLTLLEEFSRKAGLPALDRSFAITGKPPHRSLERKNVVIETGISDGELLRLAQAGYLEYQPEQNAVAFHVKAYNRQFQVSAMPTRHIGADGLRFGKIAFPFGRYPILTIVRFSLVLAAIALVVLWATGVLSSVAVQTLTAGGALLIGALALQIPQKGNR